MNRGNENNNNEEKSNQNSGYQNNSSNFANPNMDEDDGDVGGLN